MNHDPNETRNGELDEARLTAHALEQLEGAERAAAESLVAGSDRARRTVEEIRALAAEVKRAGQEEALPQRSPQLHAVLEQYLSSEEASDMNAKPEPSSGKKPRGSLIHSRTFWAAAVCALVAIVPGYLLISGSWRPGMQPVAFDAEATTPALEPFAGAKAAGEFGYEESEGASVQLGKYGGNKAKAKVEDLSTERTSHSASRYVISGKLDETADDSSGPASGERSGRETHTNWSASPYDFPSEAVPAAETDGLKLADDAHMIEGKEGAALGDSFGAGTERGRQDITRSYKPQPDSAEKAKPAATPAPAGAPVGMEEPGVFSADLDMPVSESEYGLQSPQRGGSDARGTKPAREKGLPEVATTPAPAGPGPAAGQPQWQAGDGRAPAPGYGGQGGMMGGMGMGGSGMMMSGDEADMEEMYESMMMGGEETDAEGVDGFMMMGMEGQPAQYGDANKPADEKLGQSKYAGTESKAPAAQAGERRSGLSVLGRGQDAYRPAGRTQGPPTAPAQPAPTDLAIHPTTAPESRVRVESLESLDVIVITGEKGKPERFRRRLQDSEEEGRDSYGMYYRVPNRTPGTEQYDPIVENKFLSAADHPESTFSVDVDTASYANVRRFLESGRLPPPNAVRIEELVNYFSYDYPQPDDEVPFSVNMETAQCPWNTEHRLVRVGLKGREIDPEQRGPSNLVFLLDVSGSMRDENKLTLVQYAMNQLVGQLTEDDRVAIVTYAGEAGVALKSTSGEKHKKIRKAIDGLSAGGSTHGSAGIMMAYDQAMEHFVEEGTNRVILCTDGDLNVGVTDDDELVKLITHQAKSGVFLTVLGFGTGNLKDSKMEKLADKGNGIYAYVDGRREARRVLVEQMAGSLVTIAKDVKVQIEFNPAEVASYRLIGYENRIMAAKDFDNDKKDAGEIGAGHTVTALYEIVPGSADVGADLGRELKYQRKTGRELTEVASSGDLFTLYLRYKDPDGEESTKLEFTQKDSDNKFGQASTEFRFATSVAGFAMLLRGSQYAGNLNWSAVEELASGCLGEDPGGYRNEFLELVHRAKGLGSR